MTDEYYLGIDIGTALSKIAFINFEDGRARPYIIQIGDFGKRGLIPSAILYDDQLNPIAFGEEAIEKYTRANHDGYLIREFKTRLGERITVTNDRYLESEEVYKTFLQYLKDILTLHIRKDKSSTDAILRSGVICITHPAEYESDRLGPRVRRLAQQVFGTKEIEVVAINEPSAIAQYVDHRRSILEMKPRNILVIDSGGGTTDYCHALASYPWVRSHPPLEIRGVDSLLVGGRDIDNAIMQAIEESLEVQTFNSVSQERLSKSIRHNKEYYDWVSGEDFTVETDEHLVSLDYRRLLNCVDPVMDSIVERARRFIESSLKNQDPIQVIVLAGGNSKIPMLYEKLREAFQTVEIVQVSNEDRQYSVALGAALYGASTDPIRFRLAYDIKLKYSDGKIDSLWKRNTETSPKNRVKKIVTNYDGVSSIDVLFIDQKGSQNKQPLIMKFDPPVKPKTDLKIEFEIDSNGYIRYLARPINNKISEYSEYRDVIWQYVLDTTPADI